jgi:hypothetical protein
MDNNEHNDSDNNGSKKPQVRTFTDACELVSKKILINRLSMENLRNQITYCSLFKKIQDFTEETASKKLQLIEQLNIIFEQQLREFNADRQEQCLSIYSQINELDTPNQDFIRTCGLLEELRGNMETLITRIQYLESTIPNETIVTNYTLRRQRDV